jgi:hypothetical protein
MEARPNPLGYSGPFRYNRVKQEEAPELFGQTSQASKNLRDPGR